MIMSNSAKSAITLIVAKCTIIYIM